MRAWKAITITAIGALLAACGPPQVQQNAPAEDERTGTLRVWLFDEASREPKQTTVDEAVARFEAEHQGVEVDVQYIPVDTRSQRFTGAFNDPASAPDVAEYGNTDVAGYVAAGGLLDLTEQIDEWPEGADLNESVLDTAKVDDRVYGVPWYTGIRALYYRTDVFAELGLQPPRTTAELVDTAQRIREARPDLYGISVGGKYHYALMPFIWAAGGDLARREGDKWVSTVNERAAREGVATYASLISGGACPREQCADMTGSQAVQAFASGKAAMTIGGDFNRAAVEAGAAAGKYAVVPLPGPTAGSIAPPFAGGNMLGVLKSSKRATLAKEFVQLLAGKEYQRKMYIAMGNLPTFSDVQQELAAGDPAVAPFVQSLQAGTRFVPTAEGWSKIDAQGVLPTMVQQVVNGQSVEQATDAAAAQMNDVFEGR
ncbi:N,N'-diacetylchitobiose transport system substrate-binding protein [Saccharopolyspora kobensis]|uniref:Carbohydrate ABC transporter substrate-binding protein, CUT1 family n=1 Tax=Saccharopolyspora kobensis TaxID=146035 RepID=A0A1H6ELE3_9PSEU|nr:extracellular solute-binding protein [Saccharopolyspora kobensis]SEG97856.1 N,N'-diacetylchitobiose transport system substrate-binding protein [Saccharopolyspora kobensis]SFF24183.1 carbohydrate ABC transporter substrate-binding protein, CUT1 family [Saccharopolyspora kobensis]